MSTAVHTMSIGERLVGDNQPAYIVAEVGINHNGDVELACRSIDAARAAGVDAVKFQNYRTEDFVPTREQTHTYRSQGKTVTESQHEMFKRYELDDAALSEIARHCAKVGIDFHSTPTNREGIALLQHLGVGVLKNGSDYLSNLPLIEAMAHSGLPTVLSTGMAIDTEIGEAVDAFRAAGGRDLVLLHCVSQYPAPTQELRLRRIAQLRASYDCAVGFSDHSEGTRAAALATALGACWVEKHFTLDRDLPGPDHAFSADPQEMADLVREVRLAESALGDGQMQTMSAGEHDSRVAFRLSCAAARDLRAGETLTDNDIAFFRPGSGFAPKQAVELHGRTLNCAVPRGTLFSEAMFS